MWHNKKHKNPRCANRRKYVKQEILKRKPGQGLE